MKKYSKENSQNEFLILIKAFRRAANYLLISDKVQGNIIGLSETPYKKLCDAKICISLDSKEAEMMLLFLRIFRNLDIFFGGNLEQAILWLNSYNHHLKGIPINLILTISGLKKIVLYLDVFCIYT